MTTEVQWMPVVGFEGVYEVSDVGEVKRTSTGKIMSPWMSHDGYPMVTMNSSGRKKHTKISRAVGEAFLDEPDNPRAVWVLHTNGDRKNNRVRNLRWGTPQDNTDDMMRQGNNWRLSKDTCAGGHLYDGVRLKYGKKHRDCSTCSKEGDRVRREKLKSLPPPSNSHGTHNGYTRYQCRCEECVSFWSDYQKERRGKNDYTTSGR